MSIESLLTAFLSMKFLFICLCLKDMSPGFLCFADVSEGWRIQPQLNIFVYFTCPSFSGIHTLQNTNEIYLFTIATKSKKQSQNRGHLPV